MSEAKEKANDPSTGLRARQARQFHTEIVLGALDGENPDILATNIEAAYQRINDVALADDVVIVSTTQTVCTYERGITPYMAVTITAQRVPRATLREMEMRAQIGQQVPPIKPVRSS